MNARTVTHIDTLYSEQDAVKISTLRAERWGALTTITHAQDIDTAEARRMCTKLWRRVKTIDAHLYRLTKNPVYA